MPYPLADAPKAAPKAVGSVGQFLESRTETGKGKLVINGIRKLLAEKAAVAGVVNVLAAGTPNKFGLMPFSCIVFLVLYLKFHIFLVTNCLPMVLEPDLHLGRS